MKFIKITIAGFFKKQKKRAGVFSRKIKKTALPKNLKKRRAKTKKRKATAYQSKRKTEAGFSKKQKKTSYGFFTKNKKNKAEKSLERRRKNKKTESNGVSIKNKKNGTPD